MLGAAEFAIPYYIIIATAKDGIPDGFAGIMTTIYLIAKVIIAPIAGRIGDQFSPIVTLGVSCVFGVFSAMLAITAPNWQVTVLMYIFLAFATNGIYTAQSAAPIVYSQNKHVSIYSAIVSLLCAPLYILVSFGGAAIANFFSYNIMFGLALIVYGTGVVLSVRFSRKC